MYAQQWQMLLSQESQSLPLQVKKKIGAIKTQLFKWHELAMQLLVVASRGRESGVSPLLSFPVPSLSLSSSPILSSPFPSHLLSSSLLSSPLPFSLLPSSPLPSSSLLTHLLPFFTLPPLPFLSRLSSISAMNLLVVGKGVVCTSTVPSLGPHRQHPP